MSGSRGVETGDLVGQIAHQPRGNSKTFPPLGQIFWIKWGKAETKPLRHIGTKGNTSEPATNALFITQTFPQSSIVPSYRRAFVPDSLFLSRFRPSPNHAASPAAG